VLRSSHGADGAMRRAHRPGMPSSGGGPWEHRCCPRVRVGPGTDPPSAGEATLLGRVVHRRHVADDLSPRSHGFDILRHRDVSLEAGSASPSSVAIEPGIDPERSRARARPWAGCLSPPRAVSRSSPHALPQRAPLPEFVGRERLFHLRRRGLVNELPSPRRLDPESPSSTPLGGGAVART
jgi:hypothetical protein